MRVILEFYSQLEDLYFDETCSKYRADLRAILNFMCDHSLKANRELLKLIRQYNPEADEQVRREIAMTIVNKSFGSSITKPFIGVVTKMMETLTLIRENVPLHI